MALVVRAPVPALAPFVDRLGCYEVPPGGRELVLPTGTMALLVNLASDKARWYDGESRSAAHTRRGAVLMAAFAGGISADIADWRSGVFVSFRPAGAYPFFRPPAWAIDEPLVELEALWGPGGQVLRERLLEAPTAEAMLDRVEAELLAQVVRPLEQDPAVLAAAAMLGRGMTVAQAAGLVGLAERTLLRRFRERVGLTPKGFARVRRLQRVLAQVSAERKVDWARVALACGYADQAHLVNEFRALTSLTPCQYRLRSALCRNHELPPA
jgi:AraC-like DNA-binding protein